MFDLSIPETIVFSLILVAHAAAGIVAILQLFKRRRRYKMLLSSVILAAVVSEVLWLALRAATIRAVPLTGPFESLVVLAAVFGVLYLLVSLAIDQVWFGSIMAWILFGMVVMAGLVAEPASRPHAVAATPWAIAHGATMILAAAAVMFAAANSGLYLLGSYRLKRKEVMQVLGRIPNMETLGEMNRIGLWIGFALLMIGFVSGLGLVSRLGTGVAEWLTDIKVICIMVVWVLLGAILALDHLSLLREKSRAYVTLLACALVLLAIIGVTIAGVTQHRFSLYCPPLAPPFMA